MAVGLGGPGQDGRTLRTVVESLLESPVDVHGLHQGKVEQGMAAVAAAFLAGDALGMVVPDTFEHGVTAGAEFFVFGKNGLKIRNHWDRSSTVMALVSQTSTQDSQPRHSSEFTGSDLPSLIS